MIGEANFSDHGANRLGASALMQGLADGYFVLPNTIRDYLADGAAARGGSPDHPDRWPRPASRCRIGCTTLLAINGDRTVDSFHRELGHIMWEYCGMERTEDGLTKAIDLIRSLREEFWRNVKVLGSGDGLNQTLEKAGRVADFLELAELMCIDALHRARNPAAVTSGPRARPTTARRCATTTDFGYVAAWEFTGTDQRPVLHKEDLTFEYVHLTQRSYK